MFWWLERTKLAPVLRPTSRLWLPSLEALYDLKQRGLARRDLARGRLRFYIGSESGQWLLLGSDYRSDNDVDCRVSYRGYWREDEPTVRWFRLPGAVYRRDYPPPQDLPRQHDELTCRSEYGREFRLYIATRQRSCIVSMEWYFYNEALMDLVLADAGSRHRLPPTTGVLREIFEDGETTALGLD
ncbi:MAG: hypothetical protein GY716_02975 [bacterium]|nr:hypothetical protein [bacterium]